jgi:signal transduction histidine kinase
MKCWGNIVLEEDFPLFRKHIREISPGSSDSCQLRIRHKNGSTIWVEATAECIIAEISAQARYVYGAIVNINERKLAEEAMKRSEQELRKTNKMKDKFFSIISHDLRSPFQGLIGMANILVEDEDLTAEERKEFTLKLYESLKTQFHFIDDLLTWNRIQRGAIEFIPSADDLTTVLRETLELLANSIENKKLTVVLDTPDNVTLNFDRNMVATIIRNLITNAVKFTPHGGTIKIRIDNRPDTVEVSVQDTGIGIDNSDLKKLWDSEFHRSTKGTDGEDGTGLGLILCKEFVEKHGGLISAESEINMGSTFRFSIPKNLQGDL